MKFQSMKLRFIASIAVAYLVVAVLSLFAFHLVTRKVVQKLATDLAVQQSQLDKLKLMSTVQHDLSLSLRMSASPILQRFAVDENNPALKRRAMDELESYRASLHGQSLTFIPDRSRHNYFLDGLGAEDARPRYTVNPDNRSDAWYFRVMREVERFELNVDYDSHLDLTKVWFNVVMRGEGGEKLGVCGSSIDITEFVNDIVRSPEKGVETILFDGEGAIVGHRERNYVLGNSRVKQGGRKTTVFDLLGDPGEREALRRGMLGLAKGGAETPTLQCTVGGKRYLAALSYLAEIRWFNMVLVDTDQVVASRDFLPIVITTIVSLLAVLVLIGLLLNQVVLAPVSRLAASARRLARGDFDVLLPVNSADEIGGLTRSFNEMALMVKDYTENLEHNVSERTRQFAEINDRLLDANEELEERRHQAETTLEALQASEEQLRLLLDSTAEAIYGTDLEGNCTFCNRACLSMLGYGRPEELVGRDMHWQVHRLLPNEDCRILEACRRGEGIHLEGKELWRADGSSLPVEFWSYPQYRNGRIVGTVATFLDVSNRIEAQERLLKLSRAVENSPATVVITDSRGRIEYVNPKFTEVAGYTPEEAIGRNPRILGAGVQSPEFYRELWDTISSGREWRGEFCNRRKNGEIHWEHASISPIRDERGGITHYVAVKEDVTERKRVAEELQQAKDAADAANRFKSEFLANMSHEIRTPLNAIIGFSGLALERDRQGGSDGYAGKINVAGKTLLGIVNDILDFSKIEAGKLELEETLFRMDEAIAGVVNVVQQKALEKGIALRLELPEELAGDYLGDPLRLGQVVTNLAANAVKFTEEGEVTLRLAPGERREGRVSLTFSVRDTGIGLTPAALDRLFHPFTQADGSTTRRFGGTGLGLSISKQLVELMGGEIWGESEPGRGSTFSFTAWFRPAREGEAALPEAVVPEPVRDLNGVRLLLVEDNEVNRQLAIILLSGAGAEVEVAVDGREAVERVVAGGEAFDLVLMDIQMPGMDGYQATGIIRGDARFHDLPIVAMTAHALPAERQKILAAGMNDQITKPIDARVMFETIGRALRPGGTGAPLQPAPEGGILPELAGIDQARALARLDGNGKLYLWLLRAFLQSEAGTAKSLGRAIAAGERGLAERLAHTVKGSAGSIGANLVMAAAGALEDALRRDAGDAVLGEALEAFSTLQGELLQTLEAGVPSAPTPEGDGTAARPLDPGAAKPVLVHLLRHIVESDGTAWDCLERHRGNLEGLPAVELARLSGHLSAFDYDAALELLHALCAQAGISLAPQ